MKRACALMVLVGILSVPAMADTLAEWTFETSVPTTAGPHAAEGGLFGGDALGFHSSSATVYSNPVGNGSPESFSSNNWAIGDYYQFSTSTAGYDSIEIEWDQTRSSTGPSEFKVQISTDGSTFSDLSPYGVTAVTWSSLTFMPDSHFGPISGTAALDDQADIYVRFTAISDPSGAAGTNRIDNVTITGRLIPEPASLSMLLIGCAAALRRRSR